MRGTVIAGLLAACTLVLSSTAAGAAATEVPKFQNQSKTYKAYEKLYAAAKKSPRVHAGRNVALHGRAKDGKISHNLVRREAARLWLDFHPELKAELHARAQAEAAYPNFLDAYHRHQTHLESIARCESGGNPSTDTGNGFYGKYQFMYSTWTSIGGPPGLPSSYPEDVQDHFAGINYEVSGPGQWPVCRYR